MNMPCVFDAFLYGACVAEGCGFVCNDIHIKVMYTCNCHVSIHVHVVSPM